MMKFSICTSRTDEYFKELPALQNHHRRDSEVPKLMNLLQKHKGGTQGYERPLGQLLRIVSKAQTADFHCMLSMDTLGVVAGIIKEGCEDNSTISRRLILVNRKKAKKED